MNGAQNLLLLRRVEFGTIMLWYYLVDRTPLFKYGAKVGSQPSVLINPQHMVRICQAKEGTRVETEGWAVLRGTHCNRADKKSWEEWPCPAWPLPVVSGAGCPLELVLDSVRPALAQAYSRDVLSFIFLVLTAVNVWKASRKYKKDDLLNRQQTDEWKGWMQVLCQAQRPCLHSFCIRACPTGSQWLHLRHLPIYLRTCPSGNGHEQPPLCSVSLDVGVIETACKACLSGPAGACPALHAHDRATDIKATV